MSNTKQAVFQVGDGKYSFDIMEVVTVEKYIHAENASKCTGSVKGTINLRGDVIPVYSLRKKFVLEEKDPDNDTRLIITNSNGSRVAYEVDNMQGIAALEPEQIIEVPSIVKDKDTSYMKQVVNWNGQLIIQLDPDGILTEEEQKRIRNVIM